MRVNRIAAAIAAAATVAGVSVSACSGGSPAPSVAACKAAMQAEFNSASDATPATEPAACHGIPAKTLATLAGQILASAFATPSPAPAAPRPSLTALAESEVSAHGGTNITYEPLDNGATGYAAGDGATLITVKCYAGNLAIDDAQADLAPTNNPDFGSTDGVRWGCASIGQHS